MAPVDYSIADVAALTDTPVRTVRYYIAQGLLPSPGRTGPAARYDDAFVTRLRAIRRLQEAHQPLSVIRVALDGLDEDGLRDVLERPEVTPPDSAGDYVRRLLGESPHAAAGEQPTLYRAAAPMAASAAAHLGDADASGSAVGPTAGGRSHWERIVLAPGVEIHVRRPQSRWSSKQTERLVEFAEQLSRRGAP